MTLFTLAIFVFSIWAISFYVSRTLQGDMQRLLGEQQFQTTSMVADEINRDVQYYLNGVEVVAKSLGPVLSSGAAETQKALENRAIFHHLFNSGSFFTGIDGTVLASLPASLGRVCMNSMDHDSVATALRTGKLSVSKPVIGKVLNKPVLTMAAPIRDPQG
ncbi:PDC sensor domain-containing protein [Rhodoferax sp. PAMC 29310]|uniref:PDC sensor domain-containing protein n=1 Tax=Rhodoferax sp. PAMC 29310 TaxID=2822760 RepID=UPI001B3269D1|nr:PDC sensor domain-containing protein [Rhodoferax sp. PAMC 29310]